VDVAAKGIRWVGCGLAERRKMMIRARMLNGGKNDRK